MILCSNLYTHLFEKKLTLRIFFAINFDYFYGIVNYFHLIVNYFYRIVKKVYAIVNELYGIIKGSHQSLVKDIIGDS